MTQKTIAQRYVLDDKIGSGGMGTVYKCLDTQTEQIVAIKELHPNLADHQLIERFKREGEALRDLNHPNIAKMLDAVEEDGRHYLIMEFISGSDLSDVLQHGQLPVERILNISIDLADALTRAHRLKIIHRDLKPANILISDDGILRLTDFGVAHVGSKARVTDTDAIVGTIDYLPPEAFDGSQFDERGDIWAFGVILFEMLTGKRPFAGETIMQVIQSITTEPVPDIDELRPDIPVALIDLTYRMLERNVDARIRSVRQIGLELEDMLQGRPTQSLSSARFDVSESDIFTVTKHNLPIQTTQFVGRDAELGELSKLLMDSSIRLITIIAPGGMGKTRLALQSAAQHVERFEHGAYFVDLAAVTEPERIVNAISDSVDFSFQQTNSTPQAQLEHFLSSRELLLILDNYEHLMEGASLVTDLLKAAPRLKILVTSRQRLNQSSEYVLALAGFVADDWPTPEAALNSAAVRLFMQGARRVQPDFELTPHNLKPVTRICQQVGGLPLGIVLAASWLGMLSPAEIVDEITAGVEFLEADIGDLPTRQRSIRAVFNYSWGLLSEAERDTFMRLSVFKGGFTREAAQAVSGASLRMLMMLVNKSLLRRDTTSGRYSLHELLRQFAEVRLRESGTEDDTRATHAHYYLANLTSRRDIFIGWGKHNMLNVEFIAVEMPNITQAWYYAVERRMIEELDMAETVLSWFRELRSMFATFEPMLEAAYEMLLTVPDTPRKHSLLMHTLMWQSWNALRLGKLERTLAKSRASIQLFETKSIKIKDEAQTTPYAALAVALALMGRIDEARAAVQRNQEVFLNEPSSKLAMAYYALTAVELAAQNYEAVRTAAQKGYKLFVQFRQFYLCCYLLNNWGDAEMALGSDDKARALFEESYDYMAHIGVPEGMATAQTRIADIAMRQGDTDRAQRIYEECMETYSRLGDQGGLARSLAQLAQIALDDARITKAARLQAAALEATGAGLGSMTLETLFGAATLLRSTGHSNTAHTILATIVAHPAVSHDLQQAALIALEGATAETTSLEVLVTQAARRLRQVAHDDLMGSKRT